MATPFTLSSLPPPPPRRASSSSGDVPAAPNLPEALPDPPDSDAMATFVSNPLPSFDRVQKEELPPENPVLAGLPPIPTPASALPTVPPQAVPLAAPRSKAEPKAAEKPRVDSTTTPTTPEAGEPAPRGTRKTSVSIGQVVGSARRKLMGFVHASRAALPSSNRKPATLPVILGLCLFATSGALTTILWLTRSDPNSSNAEATSGIKMDVNAASPSAASPSVQVPELPEAPKSPMAPSETSLDEPSLLLGAANTFVQTGRESEAVSLIERTLLRSPELASDPRVGKVLLRAVHAEGRGAVSASFALLEGPMGQHGAELLYELSFSGDARAAPKRRAEKWLRSKDFDRVASFPLYVTVKLRQAESCEDKHALLELAAAGGRQTLDYLRELEVRTTCAPDDLANCYPCLRADSRLKDAITKLEKRVQG